MRLRGQTQAVRQSAFICLGKVCSLVVYHPDSCSEGLAHRQNFFVTLTLPLLLSLEFCSLSSSPPAPGLHAGHPRLGCPNENRPGKTELVWLVHIYLVFRLPSSETFFPPPHRGKDDVNDNKTLPISYGLITKQMWEGA